MRTRLLPLALTLLCPVLTLAQTPTPPAESTQAQTPPTPASILSAKKLFVVNAGSDASFLGDENAIFAAFYQTLGTWGRFQLVHSPQEADLLMQLRGTAQTGHLSVSAGNGSSTAYNGLEVTLTEPHTNTLLWSTTSLLRRENGLYLTSHQRETHLLDNRDKGVSALVATLKLLVGETPNPAEQAALAFEAPKHPRF